MPGLTLIILSLAAFAVLSWFAAPGFWSAVLIATGRRLSGLASRFITVAGVRWHYLEGGAGPRLVLLHGFGADADGWLQIARILGRHFSLVIPDLPGFGESEPPGHLRFDIESQAGRVEAFLDRLGIDDCVLAGNSMGGYVATMLAARNPSRTRALWLLAPLGVRGTGTSPALSAIDAGDLGGLEIASLRQFRERVLGIMFHRRPWMPAPIVHRLARRAMAIRQDAARMLHEARFGSEPLESIAARVTRPVLLQWGENDGVVDPSGAIVLQRAFSRASRHMIAECGHLPMLEKPGASAQAFIDFAKAEGLIAEWN